MSKKNKKPTSTMTTTNNKDFLVVELPLTLGQRLDKIIELQKDIELSWEIKRVLPNISIFGDTIQFDEFGDSITKVEAINVLELLLKDLRG